MLIALLTLLLFGGGGGFEPFTKAQRTQLESVVEDAARRHAVLEQMERIEDVGDEHAALFEEQARAWLAADRSYAAGPEGLDALLDEATTARARAQGQVLDALFAMRSHLSREEWKRVFGQQRGER